MHCECAGGCCGVARSSSTKTLLLGGCFVAVAILDSANTSLCEVIAPLRMTFLLVHLVARNRTVFPSAAERRAASRISVTVTFVSKDDKASGLAPSAITARTYESSLSYGGATGLAASCSSWLSAPPRRTRRSSLFTLI